MIQVRLIPLNTYLIILNNYNIISEVLRATLMTIRTLVCCSKIQSDDLYMNRILGKLFELASGVMHSDYIGSAIVKCIMTIAFKMLEFIDQIDLSAKYFKLLFSWSGSLNTPIRSFVWSFLGQITKKKEGFLRVLEEFSDLVPYGLFGFTFSTIIEKNEQPEVKMGAVAVLGNILDHEHSGIDKEHKVSQHGFYKYTELNRGGDFYKALTANLSSAENIKALCFIIRKLIHFESPEIVEIIDQNMIKKLLNFKLYRKEETTEHCLEIICDLIETVSCCWKIKSLRTIITNGAVRMHPDDFGLLCNFSRETYCWNSSELSSSLKHNVINLLTILCTTESGLEYIHNYMILGSNFEYFMPVLCDGLQITNRYSKSCKFLRAFYFVK